MRITECSIENFGTLSHVKYSFKSGLNSLVADNGRGKSTLAAFICAMFYGLDDTKKQSLDDNDRKKYSPWTGGIFGGSLTFECERGLYRIERIFGKKAGEDTFILYNAKSGRSSDDFSSALGEELFGIDKDGFLRTVFLSEKALSEKNENKTVSAKLSGVTDTFADMAELDNAIAILEGQRRIYAKRGGAGIISDTQEKLAELDAQITALNGKRIDMTEAENELLHIEKKLEEAKSQKASFDEARTTLERERHIRTYKEQYENMRRGLAAQEEKYKELAKFFENGKPTYEEIDEARMKQMEFERAEKSELKIPEEGELSDLKSFFGNRVTEEETDRVLSLALKIEDTDVKDSEVPEVFALRVPSAKEIKVQTKRLRRARFAKSKKAFSLIPFILGMGLGIVSFMPGLKNSLVIPCLCGGCALLLLALIIFFTADVKKKRALAEERAKQFILSVAGKTFPADPLGILTDMSAILEEYVTSLTEAEKHKERKQENELALREIYDYLAKFPAPKSKTLVGAIKEIKEKHRRLDALILMSERWGENLSEKKRDTMRGMQESAFFLSRFKTVTERPFDEIRDALTEFNSLKSELDSKRSELDAFAKTAGIDEAHLSDNTMSATGIDFGIRVAEDKIFSLSKEKVLLERRIESDKAELERLEPLKAQREALLKNEQKYAKNLDIIKKTQKYLTEAHRNMTMRYLDKTKAAFDGYVRRLGADAGDFVLDTDFTLTKYEGAVARKTESYSKGTRELYSLSLRLALVDSMFENEAPFIILDDPFMSFDDKTLEKAKNALKELSQSKQIIYFTCSCARAL